VISYTIFGALIGLVGKSVSTDLQLGSFLSLFVSLFMILIGLDMLKIISLNSLIPSAFSKKIFEKLEARLIKNPKKTAFWLGAITYYLPCGFTQTMQVYALGLADPVKSALIMGIFALGTVPALMAIGYASSFTQTRFYPVFAKVMGVLIFIIGMSHVSNTLSMYGMNIPLFSSTSSQVQVTSEIQGTYQTIRMTVDQKGYSPNIFKVKEDLPVRWVINGKNVFGCQGSLVASKIHVNMTLSEGENIVEFTPKEKGDIAFSCSMGMYRGKIEVI
jgi:sulfite exporter TauE/SafE